MKQSLLIRIISATVALAILFLAHIFIGINAISAITMIAILIGMNEGYYLFFGNYPLQIIHRIIFLLSSILVFISFALYPNIAPYLITVLMILLWSATLIWLSNKAPLSTIFEYQAKLTTGLIYVGALPAMAYQLLLFSNGLNLLYSLLAIVFAGDTMAYFLGILWGNKKVLPAISPKKTIVGCLGGLLGSTVAAYLCALYFVPGANPVAWIMAGPLIGLAAQMGDFFESLIKRIAGVKDSGTIMPGHGGILDRLDGVYFAAPIFVLFTQTGLLP